MRCAGIPAYDVQRVNKLLKVLSHVYDILNIIKINNFKHPCKRSHFHDN